MPFEIFVNNVRFPNHTVNQESSKVYKVKINKNIIFLVSSLIDYILMY